ncbi:hypothetical protein LCGC14_1985040 [marine sediment metagenome]|uniref:Uncharacterized protein n=1 Tax=marine sediment metagenome TaxID=412755 RepID=A0A0F9F7Q1_9ZZZZ
MTWKEQITNLVLWYCKRYDITPYQATIRIHGDVLKIREVTHD